MQEDGSEEGSPGAVWSGLIATPSVLEPCVVIAAHTLYICNVTAGVDLLLLVHVHTFCRVPVGCGELAGKRQNKYCTST